MLQFLSVGIGGALGAMGRYGAGLLCRTALSTGAFPLATLLVNVTGSFLIALAACWFESRSAMGSCSQLFIMTGVMGGFTTFSSFSLETMNLAGQGRMGLAAVNVCLSVGLCLVGIWLGRQTGNALF